MHRATSKAANRNNRIDGICPNHHPEFVAAGRAFEHSDLYFGRFLGLNRSSQLHFRAAFTVWPLNRARF
ncbi:MAG: hypothetical protein WAM62_17035 [Pseudolabrys sp.]